MPPEVLAGTEAGSATHAAVPASTASAPAQRSSDAAVSPVPQLLGVPLTGNGTADPGSGPRVAGGAQVNWELELGSETIALLSEGRSDVWDVLSRRFESRMISAALSFTKGRRIEAASKLGIGRNTITRKIQELGLD